MYKCSLHHKEYPTLESLFAKQTATWDMPTGAVYFAIGHESHGAVCERILYVMRTSMYRKAGQWFFNGIEDFQDLTFIHMMEEINMPLFFNAEKVTAFLKKEGSLP